MTLEEIAIAALERCAEFGNEWPSTRSTMYARIDYRQRQLFERLAQGAPDLVSGDEELGMTGDLGNEIDLTALASDVVRIIDVLVTESGEYTEGQRITVVPLADPDAGLAPRVFAQAGLLVGVADDFDSVERVRVRYVRAPESLEDSEDEPDDAIPPVYHRLFVLDLAKSLAQRALALPVETRTGILEAFAAEETELLADFDRYAKNYAPTQARFPA